MNMQRVRVILASLISALVATTAITLFPVGTVFGIEPDTEELKWLSKRYPKHIFDYCLDLHPFDPGLRNCLTRQMRIRKQVLINAINQLGNYNDALALYVECEEYFPLYGVVPIGECVATRLILHSKLDFKVVEQFIYEKCDEKWRWHGPLSVRNCAANSANKYRDFGWLPDW